MTMSDAEIAQLIASEHLRTLRGYFRRKVLDGDALSSAEDADREHRIREYLQVGNGLQMTKRDMVVRLLDGLTGPRSWY